MDNNINQENISQNTDNTTGNTPYPQVQVIGNAKPRITKKMVIIGVGILLLIIILICAFSSNNISTVKNGAPEAYPNITYGDALDDFCDKCDWSYEDGDKDFVQFIGKSKDGDHKLKIIFKVTDDRFDVASMSVDGETCGDYELLEIITEIFDSYDD
ncbi:MAG: hypothetical protein ACI4RC_01305 [Oscillospiraceae bacterium]